MEQDQSLKDRSISGFAWKGSSSILQFVLSIAVTLILMQYLSPEDYGLVAKLVIILSLFNVLLNFGLSESIVQQKDIGVDQQSSLFFLSILIGAFLSCLLFFSSNFLGDYFGHEDLSYILKLFSVTLILGASIIVHRGLLYRELKFKKLALIEIGAFTLSAVVAIYLARKGMGYMAIIYQLLLNAILQFIFYWTTKSFIPKWVFRKGDLRNSSKFSIYLFLVNILNYVSELIDQFLITRFYPAATLGIYNRASTLVKSPSNLIPGALSQVLFPLFSKINLEGPTNNSKKNNDKINEIYLRSSSILMVIFTPIFLLGYLFASEIIKLLLPESWLEVVPFFKLFCLIAIFYILNLEGAVFLAKGKSKELLKNYIPIRLISIVAVCIGIQYGLQELLYSILIAEFINRIIKVILLKYYFSLNLLDYIKELSIAIFFAIVIIITIYFVQMQTNFKAMYLIMMIVALYTVILLLISRIPKIRLASDLRMLIKKFIS